MKASTVLLIFACLAATIFTGCNKSGLLDPKNPVTLTLWHPYEQRMRANMDEIINEFNSTIGTDMGIIVMDSFVAELAAISRALTFGAEGIPGAPQLPDIAVVYPGVSVTMADKGLLVDLSAIFSEAELSQYVPDFLEEGRLTTNSGRGLYVMPVAKSTEVIFVNNTIFSRFAADVDGVSLSRLATFEGILETAALYFEWSGGKAFMYYTDLFNYSLAAFSQFGGDFFAGNKYNLSSPIFQRVWDAYFPHAVKGSLAIFDSYGSHLMATGETVCILDTTASIAFLSDTVTYADNTKENCELAILPYPVFEGGTRASIQQGGGMCIFKSDPRKEYAAAVFLKWFTEPAQNIRFTANIGYMPVTIAAFTEFVTHLPENITNENIRKLIDTVVEMQKSYSFHYPPAFDGIEEIRNNYARSLRAAAENARNDYMQQTAVQTTFDYISKDMMEWFINSLR